MNTFYIFKDDDGNGLAEPVTSITQVKSYFDDGEIFNSTYPIGENENVFIYTVINRNEIDLPIDVVGPVKITE